MKQLGGLLQNIKKSLKISPSLQRCSTYSKAQRIEHYEISAYGTLKSFAKELALGTIAKLLKETALVTKHTCR